MGKIRNDQLSTPSSSLSPVKAATTGNIVLSGAQTIDGISCVAGDRVLVKNQTLGQSNGIYVVSSAGLWTRAEDANTLIITGVMIGVQSGSANGGKTFILVTQAPITLGTTSLRFIQQGTTIDARVLATADGATDDRANLQAAFIAAPEVVYSAGTGAYKISSTGTIGGAGKTHRFARGAMIHATGAGVVLTFDGTPVAPPDQQIFQIDGGASIVWGPNAPRDVHAGWFGATATGGDDAPGIMAALAAIATNSPSPAQGRGGRVRLRAATHSIQSQIVLGASGASQGYQGVELVGESDPILGGSTATLRVDTDLGFGNAAILIHNAAHFLLDSVGIDANNNADHCIQFRSDTLAGSAFGEAQRNKLSRCNFRGARIHSVLNGEYVLKPTVSGSTFTANQSPLHNDDQIYFRLRFYGIDSQPTGFSADAYYFVVNRTTNTFQLSTTMGGSAITASDAGNGVWFLGKSDSSDQSQFVLDLCDFYQCGFSDFHQPGEESLGTTLHNCWGQGRLDINPIAGVVANAATDIITVDAGALTNGDIVAIWRHASTDTMINGLNEDQLYVVRDASGLTCKLASTVGGAAIDLTSTGSGCRLIKMTAPYYFATVDGGTVEIDGCATVGYYEDVFVSGTRLQQGAAATIIAHNSQSWRLTHAQAQGRTFSPQLGGVNLFACTHSDIWGGSRASVIWDLGLSAEIGIFGGVYYRDILINNAVSQTSIHGSTLTVYGADNGFTATVRGASLAKTGGSWNENGTVVNRVINFKNYGPATLGDGTNIVTIDCSGAGYLNPKFATGYFDFTTWNWRKLDSTSLATWTNPSSNALTLTTAGSLSLVSTAATLDAGAGTLLAKAGSSTVLTADTKIAIDAHSLGTGYINFITKSGQPIYSDSDKFNFRNQAAGQYLEVSEVTPGGGDAKLLGRVSLALTSPSLVKTTCNNHDVFKVDSSGNVAIFGGSGGLKPTISGNLTAAATVADLKPIITSLANALAQIDAATNGLT